MARDYRNPRFSYIHALRDVGLPGFDATESSGALTNPSRAWDDQSKRPVSGSGTVLQRYDFDRGAAFALRGGRALDRVIVPRGHNFGNERECRLAFSSDPPTWASKVQKNLLDGSTTTRIAPSSDHIVWDFATPITEPGIEFVMWASIAQDVPEWGELWWTRIEQPTTGIVSAWSEDPRALADRFETRTGATYSVQRADRKAAFSLEHRGLAGDDLLLYEDLLRYTRNGTQPFWYEHPSSGGGDVELNDTTVTTGWTISGGTIAVTADSIEVTSTGAGAVDLRLPSSSFVAGAPTDWRASILSFDVYLDTAAAWLDDDNAFRLAVNNDATFATHATQYTMSKPLRGETPLDQYVRVQFDLEADTQAVGTDTAADLAAVTGILFRADALGAGEIWRIRKPRIIAKQSRPHLVEIVRLDGPTQDNDAPSSALGPTYTISMDLLEVTS